MSECGGCSYLGQCSLPCPFEMANQEQDIQVLEVINTLIEQQSDEE